MKGEAAIDWSHKRARKPLLAAIVRDARPAPGIVAAGAGALAEDSAGRQQIVAALQLPGLMFSFTMAAKEPCKLS